MQIGLIGLGRMGYNLVLNALEKGQEVVVYNRSKEKTDQIAKEGAVPSYTIEELIGKLEGRKVIWLMVTAGTLIDELLAKIISLLSADDIIIDGGNSFYKDSIRRAELCLESDIMFLDIGTSGGLAGARNGACMMAGGNREAFDYVEPFLKAVNVENGYGYVGKSGAGHFVKMVHNGIEYGMMEAIGEGYNVLKNAPYELDFKTVSKIYANGSVIRSWLIDLIYAELKKDHELSNFEGKVAHSGEGQWTIETAKELNLDIPVIESSLQARLDSLEKPTFGSKVVSAMRYGFGQHKEA